MSLNLKSDLTGTVFGRWTVIGPAPKPAPRGYWICQCECGTYKPVRRIYLTRGLSQSCPCSRTIHGQSRRGRRTAEYGAYLAARKRCNNPADWAYVYYGGRGIEFRFTSFLQFFDVLGPKPSPKLTLERIDNDGHYEPGNVCWATRSEQNKNKRKRWTAIS